MFAVVKNKKIINKIFPKGEIQKCPKKKKKIIYEDDKYIRYTVINFLLKFFILFR